MRLAGAGDETTVMERLAMVADWPSSGRAGVQPDHPVGRRVGARAHQHDPHTAETSFIRTDQRLILLLVLVVLCSTVAPSLSASSGGMLFVIHSEFGGAGSGLEER